MKKSMLALLLCMVLMFSIKQEIFATESGQTTIITTPLDGRPISNEYLKNLTDLYGDKFISSDKNYMDLFTQNNNSINRFANSKLIRKDIKDKIGNNNSKNTTVIINTSSYITNGLIGGRCYKNYKEYEVAIQDLLELTSMYTEPYYHIHTSMPRTLPEDRNNQYWPDSVKVQGLGHFYLEHNKIAMPSLTISQRYLLVTPSQLLMEWSYVQNKVNEQGVFALAPWEEDFLNYFNQTYILNEKYNVYVEQYKMVYKNSGKIMKSLIDMVSTEVIDQLVISIDDIQLPDFIVYVNNSPGLDKTWIPKVDGNPIKFSWARTYLQTDSESVYNYHKKIIGNEEFTKAINSSSKNINYIYGVDEIPQMIYASDLVRRTGVSTKFTGVSFDYNLNIEASKNYMGPYDMVTAQVALNNAINFVTRSYGGEITKTDKPFKIYVNKYIEGQVNIDKGNLDMLIKDMFTAYNLGYNIGLIEFYSFEVLHSGKNELFQNLSNRSYLTRLGLENNSIAQLGSYSSWNTVANAAGLGVAHAQVFGIAEQLTNDYRNTALKQSKVLAQHLLEDGVYGAQLKNKYFSGKYNMDNLLSTGMEPVLFQELHNSNILSNFINANLKIKDETINIRYFNLNKSGFPWLRAYDCYVDVDFI